MKKRILLCCHSLSGGGAEKVMETILEYLSLYDFSITVYSLHQEEVGDAEWSRRVQYRYLYKHAASNTFFLKKLYIRIYNKLLHLVYRFLSPKIFYRLFIRGEYDVEIAFIEGYATRIISGSVNPKSRKIAWVHANLDKDHWCSICYRNIKEENEAYSHYDDVICVSQEANQAILRLFSSIRNCHVIYNPVDKKDVVRKSQLELVGYTLLRRKFTLVSVGRLVPQKGFDRLLKVLKELIDEGYDLSLNIIGEGKERNKLEKFINENGLQNRVQLVGYLSNPYPLIRQADIVVCSSRVEGYNLVIAESLILGKPIIATHCACIEEQLGRNNEYGYMTQNDTRSLYEGIKHALEDPTFIDNYKNKALLSQCSLSFERSISEIYQLLIER